MKKFKKVASFVAAFTMALAVVMPVVAKADVTINVTKPADWEGMSVHVWDTTTGDITTWPGMALTQSGDKYTATIEADDAAKLAFCINDGGKGKQTTDIKSLTDTNGQGEGLSAGTYDITIGTTKSNMGHFNFTINKTGATSGTATTTVAEATNAPTTDSPATSDNTLLGALVAMVLVAGASVVVFFRKRMAA